VGDFQSEFRFLFVSHRGMSLGGSCKALYINFFTEAMSRFPTAPLKLTRCPRSLAATLSALP